MTWAAALLFEGFGSDMDSLVGFWSWEVTGNGSAFSLLGYWSAGIVLNPRVLSIVSTMSRACQFYEK